ncbi:hypothetical protein D6201_07965 [Aurantiacibacter aquimixticola]|uniref:Uncharacterized protein n=1 Tax=Aurantiacibacter aquimixticola TaxID=1958945 RepID=A0A419RWV0_9SPHN|nr:hypothetical protein D6201_07965 [Aurantiacibacter aquimixticola]
MRNTVLSAAALLALAACSQETEERAEAAAEGAVRDTAANAEVIGEEIEEGAIDATREISEGAGELSERLEAGDNEEPGPAPITGDDLSREE